MAKTKFCAGISDISDSYMGCIIDDWGVLHDGEDAFPGTVDCLKELKERKKHIIILTNDRKRADEKKVELKKMGIGPSLYNQIVTPTEIIQHGLREQKEDIFKDIGERAYVITRRGDLSMLDDTGIEVVDDVEQADFVLLLGMDYPMKTLEDYENVIRRAIQKRLKAICANQDSKGLIGTNFLNGPGLLARRYEDAGGIVHYIGKPHQYIFKYCIEPFKKVDVFPSHTVMLGDTMAHDVLGANAVGIDTCLFKSGLHAANFMHCTTLKEVDNTLKNLIIQYNNVMPKYLVDEMRWGNALPDRKHKKRRQPAS
ncbi:MAG TPA: TIGR01459 family HAD-type hydrolase [Alphaproteobacteria bacterium]|nr:TIGR01459 family HAD-type hydrolase [Alphaproteobacteria bacterium]